MSLRLSERPSGSGVPNGVLRGGAHITATEVSGWTFDPADETRPLEVRLLKDGEVLAEAVADRPRPDVNRAYQTQGDHGFLFAALALAPGDLGRIGLEARRSAGHPWQALPIPQGPRRARHYQSFDNVKGASNSFQKLKALRLGLLSGRQGPGHPLKGLSVLDLGCNEGFFCGEALRQGARRVVGIDHSRQFVGLARQRFPRAEFIEGSWWDIPDERFDVIFFLSAIHYEPEPAALLRKLADHLTPTGTLVLECGIAPGKGRAWKDVRRADGIRSYPTHDALVDEVALPFAVRLVGPSVPQKGDPVPRRVYHCGPKGGMALIVTGPTRSGKSTLADDFRRHDIPLVHTDLLLGEILAGKPRPDSRLSTVVQRFPTGVPLLGKIGQAVANECPEEFVEMLIGRCPLGADLFCIEGDILRHDAIVHALTRALRAREVRPWFVARSHPVQGWWARAAGRLRAVAGAWGRSGSAVASR
jgi:SAM-dependent methyltransferase